MKAQRDALKDNMREHYQHTNERCEDLEAEMHRQTTVLESLKEKIADRNGTIHFLLCCVFSVHSIPMLLSVSS